MNYDEWKQQVPSAITGDSLWKMEAYRLALFASDMGWFDTTKLASDKRTLGLSDQLYRSVGSIGANLAEGYSRGTGKDRARFYEYALGSARESRDWYYKGRYVLGDQVAQHRMDFMAQIVRLLLTMVPQQRGRTLREEPAIYQVAQEEPDSNLLAELLMQIPLPD